MLRLQKKTTDWLLLWLLMFAIIGFGVAQPYQRRNSDGSSHQAIKVLNKIILTIIEKF